MKSTRKISHTFSNNETPNYPKILNKTFIQFPQQGEKWKFPWEKLL